MSKMLEVRCCCRPTKLLGYLPAPEDPVAGISRTFMLKLKLMGEGCMLLLTIRKWAEYVAEEDPDMLTQRRLLGDPQVKLSRGGLAYIAEGLTIEKLRNVVGFVEAKA